MQLWPPSSGHPWPQADGALQLLRYPGELPGHQPLRLRGSAPLAEVVGAALPAGPPELGKVQPTAEAVPAAAGSRKATPAATSASEPVTLRSRVREFRTPGSVGGRGR